MIPLKIFLQKRNMIFVLQKIFSFHKKQKKNLSKLASYLKPEGILLITNTDPYGYFFDYLKSFILKNYLILNKIDDLQNIIKVAKQFFLNEFLLSKNT